MKFLKANAGSSLVEIIMALAILVTLGFFVFSISINLFKNIRIGQISSSRTQLVASVRQKVSSVKDIQLSVKQVGNEQLKDCICGSGTSCASGIPLAFTMYDQSAGSSPFTRYYDVDGNTCDQNQAGCIFEVTIQFIAQCLPVMPSSDPTPVANCGATPAELIAISYSIGANPNVVDPNDTYAYRKISGNVIHQVSEINVLGSGVCL